MVREPIQIGDEQVARFRDDGFLVIENLLDADWVTRITDRIDPLFSGKFETGIYPDEWHWRPGIGKPDATRQMCNVWKSDLMVASITLSAELGRIITLLSGWPGTRIGQDSLWMKPPGAKEISLHQDATYISYIDPPEMTTCWIALDDMTAEIGTLEYAKGSHRWPLVTQTGEFHVPSEGYRAAMERAAVEVGIDHPDIIYVEIPAGSCVIHHGNVWHGSGANQHPNRPRRSLSLHALRSDAAFQPGGGGYIYGRYKRIGDTTMDESFFPILWTRDGYRTPFLADYCADALQAKSPAALGV
ncbi:MAG: phytanoyl-CoA dioxygenase family protein [Elainellaceae cyanobacterium]